MRKLFLVLLLTTLLLGVMMVPAQADAIISTNVWGDVFGIFNATYETTMPFLPEKMTVFGTGYYFTWGYGGFGIGAGVNYYFGELFDIIPGGDALEEGLYASAGLFYENWFDGWLGYGAEMGVNLGIGYKYYLNDNWVLDGRCGWTSGVGDGLYGGIGYLLK